MAQLHPPLMARKQEVAQEEEEEERGEERSPRGELGGRNTFGLKNLNRSKRRYAMSHELSSYIVLY